MINIGPAFLAVSPTLSPPPPVRMLNKQHTGRLRKGDNLLTGEGPVGGGGGGKKSYDGEKAYKFSKLAAGLYRQSLRFRTNAETATAKG